MSNLIVKDLTPRNQYTATESVNTEFTYSFPIFEDLDLKVYIGKVEKTLTTDYTVSGAGTDNGGTVTLTTAAATGDIITIYRDMPVARTSDYQNNGDFLASTINDDLDKLVMMVQQVEEMHESRTIMLAPMAEGSLTHIEGSKADRANKYIAFTANGDVSYTAGTTSDIVPGQTGIDLVAANTPQDGRDALDVYSKAQTPMYGYVPWTLGNNFGVIPVTNSSGETKVGSSIDFKSSDTVSNTYNARIYYNAALDTVQLKHSGEALSNIATHDYVDRYTTKIYTTSGTYTVPVGVTKLMVTALGAGGGHAEDNDSSQAFGAGGSGALFEGIVNVTAGDTLTITLGAIGTNNSHTTGLILGGDGGATSITGTDLNITADGGEGGRAQYQHYPGNAAGGVVSSTTGSTGVHSAVQGGSGGHTDSYSTNEASPPGGINPSSSGILYAYGQGGGSDEPVSPYNPGAGAYDATAGMVQIKLY